MKIQLPLDEMTTEEKLDVIEEIWEHLRQNESEVPSPAWHEEVLRQREAEVASGKVKYSTLEEVRKRLELRYP